MTTLAEKSYKELLNRGVPRAIRNEVQHRDYVARIEGLLDRPRRSAAQEEYLDLLTVLVERYEEEHHHIDAPQPLDALKELMVAKSMSQAELARLLGSSGTTSDILAGRRTLSKRQIKKLAEHFHVSTDLFM